MIYAIKYGSLWYHYSLRIGDTLEWQHFFTDKPHGIEKWQKEEEAEAYRQRRNVPGKVVEV